MMGTRQHAAVGDRPPGVAVYIDPPSHHFLRDRLFDPSTNPLAGDNILAPFIRVRDYLVQHGIPVHTADLLPREPDGNRNIYVSLGRIGDYAALARRPDVILSAFFTIECPIVEPSIYAALPGVQRHVRRILSFSDPQSLLPFTRTPVRLEHFVWPQCLEGIHEAAWARGGRGFLTMINANKLPRLYRAELYTERRRAVEYFHWFGEIDLYGKGWNRAPRRVGGRLPRAVRQAQEALWEARQRWWPDPVYAAAASAWKGTVASKAETLSRYAFAICFENMILPGWITEKIFDCFAAGCVPVYWGAPEVAQRIPPESFIDMRAFRDLAELRRFLHGLSPTDIGRFRDAARGFLESATYDPFRPGAFLSHFRRFVAEDAGVEI